MEILPFVGVSIWLIAKIFVLIALTIYIIFALVVVKQVNLMTETLEVEIESIIRLISYLHLFAAIGIFILAILIL